MVLNVLNVVVLNFVSLFISMQLSAVFSSVKL